MITWFSSAACVRRGLALCALMAVAGRAAGAGTVQFADSVFELTEGGRKAFIVVRTGDTAAPVSVVLETDVAQGTAVAGVDYTIGLPAGVVDLAAGEMFKRIEVSAPTDTLVEGVEHARLTLRSPTGAALGRQNELRLLVRDSRDPPRHRDFVAAAPTAYRVGDTIAMAPVRVVREGEPVTFQVSGFPIGEGGSVDVGVFGGTATPGVDFTDPSTRLLLPENPPVADLTLATLEDSDLEGVEVVELMLSNPQPAGGVGNVRALALIEDNEPGQAGLFQLRALSGSDSRVSVSESQGAVSFRVFRMGGTNGVATVDFVTMPTGDTLSAVAGRDYISATARLVFADGVAERTFSIAVVDDTESVVDGDFRVAIANASDGTEIDPRASSITVSLTSDDFCVDCIVPIGVPACFVATAAYGSYLDPHVEALREFRDRYLLTNVPGRAFVAWYYRVSPPIAATIATSPAARAAVRIVLTPVVYAIVHPRWAAFALVMLLCGIRWRYARRGAR